MNRMDGEEERAAERRERDAAEEPREPVHERRVQRVEQHRREMKAERVSPPQTLIEPERRERQRTEGTRKSPQVRRLEERVERRAVEAHARVEDDQVVPHESVAERVRIHGHAGEKRYARECRVESRECCGDLRGGTARSCRRFPANACCALHLDSPGWPS